MDRRLILLLREAEWLLNDVSFTLMRGTCTDAKRTQLADTLAALVPLLRQDTPVVIDQEPR